MTSLVRKWDWLVFVVVVAGFVYVASQRIGTMPLPQTDESYTLQVPYEMLNRGNLALPMLRYLGGNIENAWHSYTPLFFVALSGFFKLFGWGVEQGRVFNLITAVLTLLVTWVIGRRLFNRPAALIAVVLLVSEPVFVHRSRMLRNDFAAAALAFLAFYLFEMAEKRRRPWLYAVSGLAAGAGVMCHTNVLYMLIVIGVLLFIRHGWRLVKMKETYLFGAGALAVMAYEIIYILVDYQNFQLQNRDDPLHFYVLSFEGLRRNIVKEKMRYSEWLAGLPHFPQLSRTLIYIFFILAAVGFIYLIARAVYAIKKVEARVEPRIHLLIATTIVVLFMAIVSGNKELYYIAHLAPWFALCAGVLIGDALKLLPRLRSAGWRGARVVHVAAVAAVVLSTVAYGRTILRYDIRYLREVRNPDLATFDEFKSVLRSVVPEGLCPVAMKSPVTWLSFPEFDLCFASLEERMKDAIDIDGKDYAVILQDPRPQPRSQWKAELDAKYPLLASLRNTPYGDVFVYYSGLDPRYKQLAVKSFYFFGARRGHYSDEQLSQAREIWSVPSPNLEAPGQGFVITPPVGASDTALLDLGTVEVQPDTIYQATIDLRDSAGSWQAVVVDLRTGNWIAQEEIKKQQGSQRVHAMFKSSGTNRLKLSLRPIDSGGAPIIVERASVREVAPLLIQ